MSTKFNRGDQHQIPSPLVGLGQHTFSSYPLTPGTDYTSPALGAFPNQLPYQVADPTIALVNGLFYIMGGSGPNYTTKTTSVYSFNPLTNLYTSLAAVTHGPGNGAIAVSVGTKIYLIGGDTSPGGGKSYNQQYDIVANSWAQKTQSNHFYNSGPVACYNLNGDKLIHVFSGDSAGAVHDTYDPVGDSWTYLAGGQLPPAINEFPALGLRSDGKVIIVGGSPAPTSNYANIYDPVAGTWSTGSHAYPNDPVIGASALSFGQPRENPIYGNLLFLVGGQNTNLAAGTFMGTSWVYDMYADTYSQIAPMNSPPHDGIAGTFYGNQLYCFGGRFQTSNSTVSYGTPFVDVLTVNKDPTAGAVLTNWSPSPWHYDTITTFDPAGTTLTSFPYYCAWWQKKANEYIVGLKTKCYTAGSGGSTGRTYDIYDFQNTATIYSDIIAPAGTLNTNASYKLMVPITGGAGDDILLRAVSDDGATKASNIFITLTLLRAQIGGHSG